jgi:hypothetical protein
MLYGESWQIKEGELSQQRRQQSKNGQRQLISDVELTLERDPWHLWTAGGGCSTKTVQLHGFTKSLGGSSMRCDDK